MWPWLQKQEHCQDSHISVLDSSCLSKRSTILNLAWSWGPLRQWGCQRSQVSFQKSWAVKAQCRVGFQCVQFPSDNVCLHFQLDSLIFASFLKFLCNVVMSIPSHTWAHWNLRFRNCFFFFFFVYWLHSVLLKFCWWSPENQCVCLLFTVSS